MSAAENILVIKHGALGDLILTTGLMKAIWAHHPQAKITLLTTPPFKSLMQQSNLFDRIETDPRAPWWNILEWLRMRRFFKQGNFSLVYDLQTSSRTRRYYKWVAEGTPWSGNIKGTALCYDAPERMSLHTLPRQQAQLRVAGIESGDPDIGWLKGDISDVRPSSDYVLVVPGGSAHRPEKRWPAERYAALCAWLLGHNLTPVLLGTKAEADIVSAIAVADARIVNLCNKTNFGQIAELARHARFAVGNDTGPMHIIAAAGCSSLVLFSHASDPALCAPPGNHVTVLRESSLDLLGVEAVKQALNKHLA